MGMGSSHSARASHFQRPSQLPSDSADDIPEDHHISISNKMVERLVEDATLAGGAAAASTNLPSSVRGDYKDKIYMEKLKCIDDSHSERTGLTMEDIHSLAARIDLRTANMVSVDPVCADCKERVIECYNSYASPEDNFNCWDTVGEFSKCVHEAGARRLRDRMRRDAAEHARRSRHVERAREHELRDLHVPREESTPA